MTGGRQRAAAAAEQRRGELELTQIQMGVDPTTWRDFVAGKSWPQARSRSRIEARLNWHIGALDRIAKGESTAEREALEYQRGSGAVPDEVRQLLALVNEIDDHFRKGQHGLVRRKIELVAEILDELRARVPDETVNSDDMRALAFNAVTQRGIYPPGSEEQPA